MEVFRKKERNVTQCSRGEKLTVSVNKTHKTYTYIYIWREGMYGATPGQTGDKQRDDVESWLMGGGTQYRHGGGLQDLTGTWQRTNHFAASPPSDGDLDI